MSRLLVSEEAAEYLGVSKYQIDRLGREGHLERVMLDGSRRVFYTEEILDQYIKRRTGLGGSPQLMPRKRNARRKP